MVFGIPPFGFPHLQDRRAGISKNVSIICRSLPFFYAYSILCIYLPYIMLEAMTYMDEEKVLLPKNAMSH